MGIALFVGAGAPGAKRLAARIDELAILGEPVNRVLEVDLDGEDATFTLYDLPSSAP